MGCRGVTIRSSAPFSSGGRVMLLVRMLFLAVLFLIVVVARVAGQEAEEGQAKATARAAIVRRIDELVDARLKLASLEPAAKAGDEEFLRRVYLDLTGAI